MQCNKVKHFSDITQIFLKDSCTYINFRFREVDKIDTFITVYFGLPNELLNFVA